MFDILGQMWGTMLLNALSTVCLLVGVLAVCATEKMAIAVVSQDNYNRYATSINPLSVFNDGDSC